jgi:hypothetical protein
VFLSGSDPRKLQGQRAEALPHFAASLTEDGRAVAAPDLGSPQVVSPGRHSIRVEAPGYESTTVEVVVKEAAGLAALAGGVIVYVTGSRAVQVAPVAGPFYTGFNLRANW